MAIFMINNIVIYQHTWDPTWLFPCYISIRGIIYMVILMVDNTVIY